MNEYRAILLGGGLTTIAAGFLLFALPEYRIWNALVYTVLMLGWIIATLYLAGRAPKQPKYPSTVQARLRAGVERGRQKGRS